jgi:hypothetical protein
MGDVAQMMVPHAPLVNGSRLLTSAMTRGVLWSSGLEEEAAIIIIVVALWVKTEYLIQMAKAIVARCLDPNATLVEDSNISIRVVLAKTQTIQMQWL